MHPMPAYFQTVFAAVGAWFNRPDFAYVLAIFHNFPFP
jgi:hypothetical protein